MPSTREGFSVGPTAATDATRQELPYRLRQQSLLGEFGRSAMQTRDTLAVLRGAEYRFPNGRAICFPIHRHRGEAAPRRAAEPRRWWR